MFAIYEKCIFCKKQLPHPDDRKGEGEHIIPMNIKGFWRSYDICRECMEYFKDNVDNLSVKNVHIINAINSLFPEDLNKIYPNFKYNAKDKFTDENLEMYRRGNKMKMKFSKKEKHLNLSDEDIKHLGFSEIKKILKDKNFDDTTLEEELEKLHNDYLKLKDNEIAQSEKLGISMRKGLAHDIAIDKNSFKEASPLIAKIVVFFINYILSDEVILNVDAYIENFQSLINHARFGDKIEKFTINYSPLFKENHYEKFHRAQIEISDEVYIV